MLALPCLATRTDARRSVEMGGVMRQSLASGILVVAVSMLVACGSSEPVSNDVAGGNGNEVDADFHNLKTPPLAAGQFEDRQSVVSGKSGSVRVALGGRRSIKKKKKEKK